MDYTIFYAGSYLLEAEQHLNFKKGELYCPESNVNLYLCNLDVP